MNLCGQALAFSYHSQPTTLDFQMLSSKAPNRLEQLNFKLLKGMVMG